MDLGTLIAVLYDAFAAEYDDDNVVAAMTAMSVNMILDEYAHRERIGGYMQTWDNPNTIARFSYS